MDFKAQWQKPFTPGPWRAEEHPTHRDILIQSEIGCINGLAAWFSIGLVRMPDFAESEMTDGALDPDTALANARLIAAAPDLLEALQFIKDYTINSEAYEMAIKAIDKALGNG